jgi:hypothetical protein
MPPGLPPNPPVELAGLYQHLDRANQALGGLDAAAGYWILRMLQKRQPVLEAGSPVLRPNESELERV